VATAAAAGGQEGANPPQRPDVAELPVENLPLLVIGVMGASLLQVLDITIANVAIPHMQSALGATADTVTWVLTSYIIAEAVAMPITGWLADRFGGRAIFIWSTAAFIVFSMLCGIAQNLEQMVLFRSLQGIAAGFMAPLSQAFLLDCTKPSRHPQMMAIWGMGIILGPILGPVLGGWLTESWNWRFIYYINLPLGIAALTLLVVTLPERRRPGRRFDMSGFLFIGLTLAACQLLLDRGHTKDWFESLEIWIYAGVGVSALWLTVTHLATARHPLFERELFRDRNFVVSLLFMIMVGLVMFAVMALLPPMMQHLLGYGVIDTGLALMPRGLGVLTSMVLAGALMRFVDGRVLIAIGLVVVAFSLWEMSHWSLAVDYEHIWWTGIVQGLGMGIVFIPLQAIAFATLSPRLRTDGSSLLNLFRSIGASAGISITTVLLTRSLQTSHAELASNVTAATTSAFDISEMDRFQVAGEAAFLVIDGEINRQAAMIGYLNDFWLMMWLCIVSIPLVLLLRGPQRD
jgi:DHA2 family multidrug resistance protein